ncbi:adenylate/guanylate cyclase domain-containing protein [Spirulina sp. CS-785/01]|uniref:adenylate/guanylate cyclase domain-containing protein n=1 Tax=Spirulina sp. CS-785/01 TaxID=3021716 RepID=UPI00232E5911|nr:adenylate/guanylate cyclase domain-containing protein [Spirulina sp. CS-785/01]MDB9312507.1 adenylate/guanylate cyclase domain-containing protein [Spirulina sp. CS-785/01]
MIKSIPVLRWGQQFLTYLSGQPRFTTRNYPQWQQYFLIRRLNVLLWLSLALFLSLTIPRFLASTLKQQPLPDWWYVDMWIVVGLGVCLGGLRIRWGRRHAKLIFVAATLSINTIEQIAETVMGGSEFNLVDDIYGWTLSFFIQATIVPIHWRLHLFAQLLVYGLYFAVKGGLGYAYIPAEWTFGGWVSTLIFISALPTISVYFYEKTAKAEFKARQQLENAYYELETEQEKLAQEKERSERLLRNILPESIACQLKQESQTIAETYKEVTVLFADLVNFTELSEHLSARELVTLLNAIFSRFDQLSEQYQLEKIKTIGDAYMVVAGLPEPREDHAQAVAAIALAMQETLREFNQQNGYSLNLRIGIHTGEVVAGVIGLKKFAYDLWGDTVNTASRMESHGMAGKIQVSQATYQYLKSHYHCQQRGIIPIKGKGEMQTYFLLAQRQDSPQPPAPSASSPTPSVTSLD